MDQYDREAVAKEKAQKAEKKAKKAKMKLEKAKAKTEEAERKTEATKIEIAKKLLKLNIPAEQIQEITGLKENEYVILKKQLIPVIRSYCI